MTPAILAQRVRDDGTALMILTGGHACSRCGKAAVFGTFIRLRDGRSEWVCWGACDSEPPRAADAMEPTSDRGVGVKAAGATLQGETR